MSKIPVKALKELASDYGLTHVIVYGYDGKKQHIATYGKTIEQCSQVADFGNKMMDALGWPSSLHGHPSTVKKLKAKIAELKEKLDLQTYDRVRSHYGKWYFYDEDWERVGPWDTEYEAAHEMYGYMKDRTNARVDAKFDELDKAMDEYINGKQSTTEETEEA